MITLTSELEQFMKGQNLEGLKPFAVLLRNKWVEEESASESESGSVGHYELDTANPIDISDLIVKPNTLSMTLDVNEIAQYNANNVTLTLSDTKNQLVEETENSFFPSGYQLYGSRVVLYYGTDDINKTRIFTGVIKDLPTYKPEQYQVDLKLVSPLEMLKDIEAKDFSDKVIGETLTYIEDDSDGHKVYHTSGTGVGGFEAVYANGTKLFEGVDYEVEQTNALGLPAKVTIINSDYYSSTITADYYTWKTGLTVEQIVAGLVGLAGYDSGTEDIRNVVWNTGVRSQIAANSLFSVGFKNSSNNFVYSGNSYFYGGTVSADSSQYRYNKFPTNYVINLEVGSLQATTYVTYYEIGDFSNGSLYNGFRIGFNRVLGGPYSVVIKVDNGNATDLSGHITTGNVVFTKNGSSITIKVGNFSVNSTVNYTATGEYNERLWNAGSSSVQIIKSYSLEDSSTSISLNKEGIVLYPSQQGTERNWISFSAQLSNSDAQYAFSFRTSNDGSTWTNFTAASINSDIGISSSYIQTKFELTSQTSDIDNAYFTYLSGALTLQLVNLSGLTVLEALQDFALISGYEFGVDRQGVFFFRPRVASTTPTYTLGHSEISKVDTVKRNFSDFFTKLTLTFSQRPLEFYANTGESPTLVDKYGVINKEIDKPDIVNYDNPELAQAIGPQLLEVYSSLPNVIQVTCKLNLALELGDIVSLQRNYSLIEPNSASDYVKFINQQTYYRACKITGMNYNFAKKQITYTLRDVSNTNNMPGPLFNEYVYEYPIEFGVKE